MPRSPAPLAAITVSSALSDLIHSPQSLQADLDSIVGVVKHGLFIRIAYQAFVGGPEGVKTLNREIAS